MPAFTSSTTTNPVLAATFSEFLNDPGSGYIGSKFYPTFNSQTQNGKYYKWDEENVLNFPTDLKRAPSSAYGRTSMQLSDDSYNTADEGIEVPVDDSVRAQYGDAFNADIAAARRAASIVLYAHEKAVKAEVEANAPTSAAVNWGTDAVAVIQTDVHTASEAIRLGVGMKPNVCYMTEETWFQLKTNTNVVSQIQYTAALGVLEQLSSLASLIGVAKIEIMGGIENSANAGQTVTPGDIWSLDDVYFAIVNPTQDLEVMNAGRTFVWTGGMGGASDTVVETYREEKIKSDIHRAWHYRGLKTTAPSAMYRLTSVLS